MNNYLVIADDFTGANDTGVQIRRRGIPVRVVFSGSRVGGGGSCVLDTESRLLSDTEAYNKILSEGEKIPFGNFSRVIQKVDSTLRGNIACETKALDQCYRPELIIFTPAFPDLGRTTINRIHQINGTPISKSEFARESKAPARNDDIRKIMTEAFTKEEVIHVGLEALRSGNVNLNEARIFTFDVAVNEDLEAIVRMALATEKRVLWVGCAGLADILLRVELSVPPVLAVVASLSSVTRDQVLFAEGQGISLVKMPLHAILEKTISPEDIAKEAIGILHAGKDVILLSSSTYSVEEYQKTEEVARHTSQFSETMGNYTQDLIGKIALMILEHTVVSGLFLSGGDTAISCFEKAGAIGSKILTEIAIGIPLMQLTGGKYEGLKVVTKAGAFGKEDAIFYGIRKLREIN